MDRRCPTARICVCGSNPAHSELTANGAFPPSQTRDRTTIRAKIRVRKRYGCLSRRSATRPPRLVSARDTVSSARPRPHMLRHHLPMYSCTVSQRHSPRQPPRLRPLLHLRHPRSRLPRRLSGAAVLRSDTSRDRPMRSCASGRTRRELAWSSEIGRMFCPGKQVLSGSRWMQRRGHRLNSKRERRRGCTC